MRKGKIHIGTSGWHYKHWKGTFYAADIKESAQFAAYLKFFSTVELNNSFYRLPTPETFENWRINTPKKFIFAVKASRFITHMKKLNFDKQSIRKFFTSVSKLQEKMGVILFQLPPRWQVNTERLKSFLSVLPSGYRYTFEFREHTWYNEEVYAILREHNCAFCIYELEYHTSPMEVTADFVYVRLHGPGNKYQGSYSDVILQEWATRCKKWQKEGKDVFIYFDNDQEGYAAFNAIRLKELVAD
jgi:uncharacterized protein YecE (DUF72 family)